jgi:GR25 family glycosyltransferase involved in LPS biosynthesis
MKRVIYFLIIVIILLLVLGYVSYRKFIELETYKNDKQILKNYISQFHGTFLQKNSKYTIPFPIYYLNMDKDTDRLDNLIKEKETYIEAKMTRIRGFNGKQIKNRKTDTIDGITFVNYYQDLSNSEIGCCVTHLMAINEAWKNGDQMAMIIEDDISFSSTAIIPNLQEVINKAPDDWDILQLASFGSDYDVVPQTEIKYIKRKYPNEAFWSCGCYILNRRAMEKIIKIVKPHENQQLYVIQPIRAASFQEINNCKMLKYTNFTGFPLYGVSDGYIYDLVNTYSTLPSLFLVNNSELDSTMHTDHTDYHVANALTTAKRLETLYLK